MTELLTPGDSGTPLSSGDTLPRCCQTHPDWPTLSEHLLVAFPSVAISDVIREVRAAKTAVADVGLDGPEALEIGELIARHQLMLLAGQRVDAARLDPERHMRSIRPAAS